jgi:CRP/FNR family transcriptional regulator
MRSSNEAHKRRSASAAQTGSTVPVRKFEAGCATCDARTICPAGGLPAVQLAKFQDIVYLRRTVKRGEALFVAGDACTALYVLWQGSLKSTVVDSDGHEQVTGFYMAGDALGVACMGGASHGDTALALEECEVCVLPHVLIEPLAREVPALQHALHAAMSEAIVHNQRAMMRLGSMRADERLASFLLGLSRRSLRRGLSGHELQLPMTRIDIGSYLGLTIETVSRLLSLFQKEKLVQVNSRQLRLLDIGGLEAILQRNLAAQRRSVPQPE